MKKTEDTVGKVLRTAFSGTDGKTALLWLANECGYFETDPAKIRPELLALFNKIMFETGVFLNLGALAEALTGCMRPDLTAEYRQQLKGEI